MKEFEICVIETLSKTIHIEADDYESALGIVEDKYNSGEIVLTADDFRGKTIE